MSAYDYSAVTEAEANAAEALRLYEEFVVEYAELQHPSDPAAYNHAAGRSALRHAQHNWSQYLFWTQSALTLRGQSGA